MDQLKFIKLKNDKNEMIVKEMSCTEVYEQFKNMLYRIVHSFNNSTESEDDLMQIAGIGLIKAYNHYDIDKNILFMTFMARVVTNEILMQLRKERKRKKFLNEISFNDVVAVDNDGSELTVESALQDSMRCEDEILKRSENSELMNFVNEIDARQMIMLKDIYFEHKPQLQIAAELNISQSYVSRLVRRSLIIIRKKYEATEKKEVKSWLEL